MYKDLTLKMSGAAAVITLNRPDSLNAVTYRMMLELSHALAAAEKDENVVGIVLTGAGRGFCAGIDLNTLNYSEQGSLVDNDLQELQAAGIPGDPDMGENFISGFTYLMSVRKPIIAAVNGACAGMGLSIALLCDMRFAAEKAKFVTSFSHRGLVAEHGQSWILPRVVGPSKALDLFWSSRKVLSDEAKEIGLIDRVFAEDELLNEALNYINGLAKTSAPMSMKTMKAQVYRHLNMSLGDAMKESDELMNVSVAHPDHMEGVAAFLEKRSPNFSKVKV